MNKKAFLACVLMCVILTGCETAKKISQVIKNPNIQVGSLKEQPSEIKTLAARLRAQEAVQGAGVFRYAFLLFIGQR